MYTSILHGLLAGFLFSMLPWFFFEDPPLPNFFDAEAEADEAARRESLAAEARERAAHAAVVGGPVEATVEDSVSARVSQSPLVGAESVTGVVFSKRMKVGRGVPCSLTTDRGHPGHAHQRRARCDGVAAHRVRVLLVHKQHMHPTAAPGPPTTID